MARGVQPHERMALTPTQKRALVDLLDRPARPSTAPARRVHQRFVAAGLVHEHNAAYHLTPLGLTVAKLVDDERRAHDALATARVESPHEAGLAEARWRSAGYALRQATASLTLGSPR